MADSQSEKTLSVDTPDHVVAALATPAKAGALSEKAAFGVEVQPQRSNHITAPTPLQLKRSNTSDQPPSPTSRSSSFDAKHTNAFSPFYSHPPCSFEQSSKASKSRIGVYQHDVESQAALNNTPERRGEPTRDCAMWPSQQELKRRAKTDKKRRCSWFPKMNKKAKIITSIIAILLIVGVALILGFVISKKVGGGFYASASNPNKPVP